MSDSLPRARPGSATGSASPSLRRARGPALAAGLLAAAGACVADEPAAAPPTTPAAAAVVSGPTITVLSATYAGNQGAVAGNATAPIAAQCGGKALCDLTVSVHGAAAQGGLFPPPPTCAPFADVRGDDPMCSYLRVAYDRGVMPAPTGCAPGALCPTAPATRAEVAAYLIRAAYPAYWSGSAPYFEDVPPSDPSYRYVQAMRDLGITSGCQAAPARYCPDREVTRGELAVFLMRARSGDPAGSPGLEPSQPVFADVPPQHPFYHYIQQLAALGITSGTSATTFTPDAWVTKEEAATFLTRAMFPGAVAPGMPFAGRANDLRVDYACSDGARRTAIVDAEADGKPLRLACGLAYTQACLDGRIAGEQDWYTGKTVCALPAGLSVLDGSVIPGTGDRELHVRRASTILRGAPSGSTVRRGAADLGTLIYVDGAAANAAIDRVTVDGNRFAFDHFGAATFPAGCYPQNTPIADVEVTPPTGVGNVLSGLTLVNAPGTALLISGPAVRVTGSTITGARSTGVHLYGDAALLDHNTITQSGTAAITVHGGYARILANTLTRNRFEQPDGVPGGQLNLEPSSRFATVSGNTLDGAGYQIGGGPIALVDPLTGAAHTCPAVVDAGGAFPLGVDGVEGYGADHVLDGNTVVNHANTGLLIKGAARWRLNGNNVANNGAGVVFLPLWGQPNVDVALTQMTITGSARQGLSLQAMTATGAAPAGCSTTTVVGGAPRIERIGEVAAAYDGCQ